MADVGVESEFERSALVDLLSEFKRESWAMRAGSRVSIKVCPRFNRYHIEVDSTASKAQRPSSLEQ